MDWIELRWWLVLPPADHLFRRWWRRFVSRGYPKSSELKVQGGWIFRMLFSRTLPAVLSGLFQCSSHSFEILKRFTYGQLDEPMPKEIRMNAESSSGEQNMLAGCNSDQQDHQDCSIHDPHCFFSSFVKPTESSLMFVTFNVSLIGALSLSTAFLPTSIGWIGLIIFCYRVEKVGWYSLCVLQQSSFFGFSILLEIRCWISEFGGEAVIAYCLIFHYNFDRFNRFDTIVLFGWGSRLF